MASKCSHCGSIAVDDEDGTCRACGIVTEDIKFGSEAFRRTPYIFPSHQNRLKSSKSSYKPPSFSLSYGLNVLRNLCHLYSISSERQAEIAGFLKKAYKARSYREKEDVGILSGCCILLVQRKYHKFISINDLCSKLKCSKKKFSRLLKFLRPLYHNDEAKDTSESDENFSFLKNTKEINSGDELPESVETQIPALLSTVSDDEKVLLIEKTKKLVKLAHSCWLLSGRSPRGVIIACAFLCWKSMNPSRKSAAFSRFCSAYGLHDRQAVLRIPELLSMLLKLGSKIPSYAKDYVNKKNVLFHLNYILENSETLRNDLLEEENSVEAINCKEYSSFRIMKSKPKRIKDDTCIQYDPDMRASDVEISDSEISSYIRTGEHVKLIEQIKENFEKDQVTNSDAEVDE